MIISRLSRKFLKILAIIFGSILVLLTAFHFWFINRAEGLIEDMVESRSNGKLRLEVRKFKFNWFSYDMELRDAVFFSADSSTAATSYRFSVKNIHITVREIIPLVFENKILIDSLRLDQPDIRVTRNRIVKDPDSSQNKSVSLPQEMGRVYKSIQDALDVLKVNRFHIDNGKFSLINRIQHDAHPVTITNIDFHLDNLQVDTSVIAGSKKILFSDNVALQTHDQDILFPDGRHRLKFKNFRINILNKLVEFDSCTISAIKDDSSKSSFTIFFDKLLLTNIDFDTLYQKEVIKADSVYCINPRFRLDVELEKRTGPRKPAPKLNDLIQQLTGDLQLAFVVVKNGSFDINTIRDGRPSSFTSKNNNFELQGLQIRKDAPRPLTVKSFAMAIRNYENFLGDSTYAMQFDSVHLINNSIFLSNFSLKQMRSGDTINRFSMPQFELKGLSWDDLVFEQKLSAERATLYRPVISYTVPGKSSTQNKQDVFQTLAGINDIIELNQLDINDGEINIFFNGGSRLRLDNAYVSVEGKQLSNSKRFQTIQQAVKSLRFKKGVLKLNDLTVVMEQVKFTGSNGALVAGKTNITDEGKKLDIKVDSVSAGRLLIDNNSGITEIDGLNWKNAELNIDISTSRKNTGASYLLTNMRGVNTRLKVVGNGFGFTTFQESISVDRFLPGSVEKMKLDNFQTSGRDFDFEADSMKIIVGKYELSDMRSSKLNNISFKRIDANDSVVARVPALSFIPDLNSLIKGKIVAEEVNLSLPIISISHIRSLINSGTGKMPVIDIDRLNLEKPEIHLKLPGMIVSKLNWNSQKEKNDFISIKGFKTDSINGIRAERLELLMNDFNIEIADRNFGTGRGMIRADAGAILIEPGPEEWLWEGKVNDIQLSDLFFDSLGSKNGRLNLVSARLNDLEIRSNSFNNVRRLVKENGAFRLREITGLFENDDFHLGWNNVNFDKYTKTFSVDSVSFAPMLTRESFIDKHQYQTDYIKVKSGKIILGPFDIDTYLEDSVLNAGKLSVADIAFSSYRDKHKPFLAGKIKPLPVDALQKIPFKFSIDTINLLNSTVEYAELNEKTNMAGTVQVTELNAQVLSAKNYDQGENDSLHISATANLMDSIKIKLEMKESFLDSLSGFLLNASVSPVDATVLNEVLAPLASVRLQSAYLDTLSMQVVGSEFLAVGEMKMFYNGLKIRMLKDGSDQKRGLFKGLLDFFANAFVIKNSNRKRATVVFQERIRDKSAINYVVKIALSGITSTIGVKNNKKLLRKYKKELRKRNLPPLDFDLKNGG